MREHPIIFSGPEVRAILEGHKMQTRRVVKFRPPFNFAGTWTHVYGTNDGGWAWTDAPVSGSILADVLSRPGRRCPFGDPGNLLWVREACHINKEARSVEYSADGVNYDADHRLTPSIFMPRWASRITLEITEVRVQRLQEISHDDIAAEGALWALNEGSYAANCHAGTERAKAIGRGFGWGVWANRWDSINARTFPWSSNPWVWTVTFTRTGKV